jgi:integrase
MAKAKKVLLTKKKLDALRPAPAGERYEIMDANVPGLGIRVTDKGKRTFVLVGRFPGGNNPTRRAVGEYGALTLEAARQKAREWIALVQRGTDPKVEEQRLRYGELRKQRHTFATVAEEYLKQHVAGQRTARDTTRAIRKELIVPLGAKPVAEVTREDVTNILRVIKDRAPYMAHIVYGHVQSLYAWAINEGTYGLEAAPTDRMKPAKLIGAKKPRQRVLTDNELRALWRATVKMEYPFGPMFQLLALTGMRKAEAGDASWHEIDLGAKLLVVPAARFKMDAQHLVPLSADACALLEALPRFGKGDFLFSMSLGEKPVGGFSKAKSRLDELMAEQLGAAPEPFVIHDIRRTVRTRLSSLRVSDAVAEMVIGHGRKGIQRVYDQHGYEAEMREALEAWAARLRSIVEPPPPNVVQLGDRRA